MCRFRGFLVEHDRARKRLEVRTAHLQAHGITLREGTLVDATLLHAPPPTQNQDRQRDPEMKSTKKGTMWPLGMTAPIGADTQGVVSSVVTAAHVHDSVMMDACWHGEEEAIYGDKAYACARRKPAAEARGVPWCVSRKASPQRALSEEDQAFNQEHHRVRARVEHPFGVVKHQWGYRKTRYRGWARNASQVYALFALAHFYRARKRLARL